MRKNRIRTERKRESGRRAGVYGQGWRGGGALTHSAVSPSSRRAMGGRGRREGSEANPRGGHVAGVFPMEWKYLVKSNY
jgi:hypothetical protein